MIQQPPCNSRNVVGAYVALATPREQRHVVVTGFQARSTLAELLRNIGKLPPDIAPIGCLNCRWFVWIDP